MGLRMGNGHGRKQKGFFTRSEGERLEFRRAGRVTKWKRSVASGFDRHAALAVLGS